ncbi:Omp28-related outer membrane protein [Prevotella dentasini]|uniref:Omp28-related outer membrane protein n=1 Tax=Prevotella dentasini TaxID=589537 RepID=UPI001F39BC9B|nr:Omp28-related outer membrane protein [Prevotella dentasini]
MIRKLLLLTFAATLGLTANAQVGNIHRDPSTQSFVQNYTQRNAPAAVNKLEAAENQVWWSPVYNGEGQRSALGTQTAETIDQAIFVPGGNPVLAGNTIKAVRIYFRSKKNLKDLKVWLSKKLPAKVADADYSQAVDMAKISAGDLKQGYCGTANDIELTTPYSVGTEGVYIGYSYTVTALSEDGDKFPIVTTYDGGNNITAENGLLLRTSANVKDWTDCKGQTYGNLAIMVLAEGTFTQNALTPQSVVSPTVGLGGTIDTKFTLANGGSAGVSDFDYTITSDGVAGEEKHVKLNEKFTKFGGTFEVIIKLNADEQVGVKEKILTITKVNGVKNETTQNSLKFNLTTLKKLVKRGVVVEEFTGTGCGWCPRGLVGMEKMRKKFGDSFVGVGIHQYNSNDAMYFNSYATIGFKGAPSCIIDRKGDTIDPYYGTGDDICIDFQKALERAAKVGVEVKGEYNEDYTKVTATATVDPLVNGKYTIAYALIVDGITGTTSAWKQANYYASQVSADQLPEDLQQFGKGGSKGTSTIVWNFDDVLIGSSYSTSHVNQASIEDLVEGKVVTNTYMLEMPKRNAMKKAIETAGYDKVAVIAMIINPDGSIENAAKSYLSASAGIDGVSENKSVELKEVARYTVDGRRISAPQRGLNIVKMSDGSTVKVMVK